MEADYAVRRLVIRPQTNSTMRLPAMARSQVLDVEEAPHADIEEGSADEAADDGADDPEDEGGDPTPTLPAREDGFRNRARNESDE